MLQGLWIVMLGSVLFEHVFLFLRIRVASLPITGTIPIGLRVGSPSTLDSSSEAADSVHIPLHCGCGPVLPAAHDWSGTEEPAGPSPAR